MEQADNTPSQELASQPILSPHIAGWFFPSVKSLNAETNINAMQQAMNTSLPLTQLVAKELSCTSTDSVHQEGSCTITITGYPRWTEPALAIAATEKATLMHSIWLISNTTASFLIIYRVLLPLVLLIHRQINYLQAQTALDNPPCTTQK